MTNGKDDRGTKSRVPKLPLDRLTKPEAPMRAGRIALGRGPKPDESRYGDLQQPGSDQAWREKQLLDVIRVGRVLDEVAAGDDPEKLKKLQALREQARTNYKGRGAGARAVMRAEEKRELAKDIAGDNWSALLGMVAAIGDTGNELAVGAADVTGQAMKLGAAGTALTGLATVVEIIKASKSTHLVKNPRFEQNGWGDGHSPRTKEYFLQRRMKRIGGAAASAVGSIAATYTAVNTLGLARHGIAVANTIAHLAHLGAEMERMRRSEHFQRLMRVVLFAKQMKLINRGGALVADAIPGCAIASAAVGAITGIPTAIRMMTLGNAMTFAAIELHWRAFVEQRILPAVGGANASGPAMRVAEHLYIGLVSTHRFFEGPRRLEFIKEPAGWMVLRDKMALL